MVAVVYRKLPNNRGALIESFDPNPGRLFKQERLFSRCAYKFCSLQITRTKIFDDSITFSKRMKPSVIPVELSNLIDYFLKDAAENFVPAVVL